MSNAPLLVIDNLSKYFNTAAGQLHAVDGVSFTLEEGKTLGIVGESGCGKSTTGRCILKLIEPTSGKIIFQGNDITKLSRREMRPLRQKMQMVFQDPFSSLDPRETVMQLISEPIIEHKLIKGREAIEERTLELMRTVGLAERYANVYPHELDGGRRQRIGIARALAMNPKIIVCDEPVSALDVSIQAQILNLLKQLQKDLGLTYIFITHDLSVVKYFSDDIVSRFCEWVKIVYGEKSLETNLDFIAKALGNKGNTSREVIRNYFLNDFFKDHCNTYSVTGSGKRPIYWLFDSGKQNGFKALIYMHRYDADTVGRVRTDYLHKAQKYVETAMQSAQYTIDNATSASEKSRATKAVTKYTKQLAEMKIYDEAIAHVANQRIEIDLDDGVKVNYAKFQDVEVAQEGKKALKIDLLAKI